MTSPRTRRIPPLGVNATDQRYDKSLMYRGSLQAAGRGVYYRPRNLTVNRAADCFLLSIDSNMDSFALALLPSSLWCHLFVRIRYKLTKRNCNLGDFSAQKSDRRPFRDILSGPSSAIPPCPHFHPRETSAIPSDS